MTFTGSCRMSRWENLGHYSGHDRIDALLYCDDSNHWLTVWIAPLAGKSEIVGLELMPATTRPPTSRKESLDASATWARGVAARGDAWIAALDEGRVQRITSAKLSSFPLRRFFADLREFKDRPRPNRSTSAMSVDKQAGYDTGELEDVEYLIDA